MTYVKLRNYLNIFVTFMVLKIRIILTFLILGNS